MVNKIKWVPIYLWVCAWHVHSMPTSATNFKDPAFGPYFELSTRQSLKHTTTIDYDQADFDEFGNEPGIDDVLGSPDTINIDPDADQGPDYQAGAGPEIARHPLLPLYTNTPDGVTPIRGSGGISDENRTGRYRTGYSLNDSTAKPDKAQNKAASDSDNRNIGSEKQKSSADGANKDISSTKSADDSNSTNLVANGTDVKQSAAGGTDSHMDSSPGNNDELSNTAYNNANDNKQGNKSNGENSKLLSQTKDEQNTKDSKQYVNHRQFVETNSYEKNDKTRSGNKLNNIGPPFQSDESASKDVSSSDSTSRDNSAQTDSESYETRYTSASSSGGSASDSTSGESYERNSGESNSAEYSTYANGQESSSSVAVVSGDMTKEEMDLESLDTSKSKDLSGDVDRSSDISTSNESGNSASDETGSSSSNESGSKASGESVSDESGDGTTRERTDSASSESGSASTREETDSTSIERSEDVTRENANGVSDERVDNDPDEKSSSAKKGDGSFSDETGSDSHSQGSSQSPEVNSSEENNTSQSSGSKSNISAKDDDNSVSYEVPNSSGEHSPTSNSGPDKSGESLSSLTHANNDYVGHNGDMSGSKPNKLVECFRQTGNDTDCFLLRSLHSICWNQFSSKCWSGVSRLRKTKMSHLSLSNSGSSNLRYYDESSESTDVDDPFSDSFEASDSSSDASGKSLSLETIENLSASYEKANGIFEVIMLIKEACPSICALAESAQQQTSIGNGQETLLSPTQDSSESSDEDDILELSTDSYTDTRDDHYNANVASSQPTSTRYASESNSIDVTVDTSSGSSNDDSQSSSDTSSDYSYENYSASDNTSE